jgi:hypothetical protein
MAMKMGREAFTDIMVDVEFVYQMLAGVNNNIGLVAVKQCMALRRQKLDEMCEERWADHARKFLTQVQPVFTEAAASLNG